MSIWYCIAREIFPRGGFRRSCTMGCGGPKTPKMSKISSASTRSCRAPQKREPGRENENIIVHQGDHPTRQLLQNSNRFTGLGDPFGDSAGVTFHDISRMTPGTVKFLFCDRYFKFDQHIVNQTSYRTTVTFLTRSSTDNRKGNIFVSDYNSMKFRMVGARGTYCTVPYQSFKEGVE
jgi:hypothetical protein